MARFQRVLVANRGEIAGRIIATVQAVGLEAVAVFSDVDRDAHYVERADQAVHLAGRSAADTYLNIEALLAAARASGAQAIHPGYGFLSENADFARAVSDAGLTWIGPSPALISELGDKVIARTRAEEAGVPVAPAAQLPSDPALWGAAADEVGYPLLVKATAGGGGRGMRQVIAPEDLVGAVESAAREAASAFGDERVFLERYLANGRHIEVQVFGDEHGNRVHLFERDCSVQRRHQKVIEEAPAPTLSEPLRTRLTGAAVALVDALGYVGAGTVEFLVDESDTTMPFVFLEMNTRLQVEHPVTEAVTGVDLVAWQLEVAQGRPLPLRQTEITCTGHAIEARLYAEDPARDHAAQIGRVQAFTAPAGPGLRTDAGIRTGSVVTADYDPMLAKVIAHAPDRGAALGRLTRGLSSLTLHGVTTNRTLLRGVLRDSEFAGDGVTTGYLDAHAQRLAAPDLTTVERHVIAVVAASRLCRRAQARVQTDVPAGWRNVGRSEQTMVLRLGPHELTVTYCGPGGALPGELITTVSGVRANPEPIAAEVDAREDGGRVVVAVTVAGVRRTVRVTGYDDGSWWTDASDGNLGFAVVPRFADSTTTDGASGGLAAPVPGTVTAVQVRVGDVVAAGATLVLLEAMKMEHTVVAAQSGIVAQVRVAVGSPVDAHDVLVVIEPHEAASEGEST